MSISFMLPVSLIDERNQIFLLVTLLIRTLRYAIYLWYNNTGFEENQQWNTYVCTRINASNSRTYWALRWKLTCRMKSVHAQLRDFTNYKYRYIPTVRKLKLNYTPLVRFYNILYSLSEARITIATILVMKLRACESFGFYFC